MKWILAFMVLLFFITACAPAQATLEPVDTVVYLTLAARPITDTPVPPPTEPSVPAATKVSADINPAPGSEATLPPAAESQCVPATTARNSARVIRVLTGDTIEVAVGNDAFKVKYIGVVAPQMVPRAEYYALDAVAQNKKLVNSQVVSLVAGAVDKDDQGRLLRYVFVGDTFINYQMIRLGYARAEDNPADPACKDTFAEAQSQANAAVAGLWAPTPVPTATPRPTRPPTSIISSGGTSGVYVIATGTPKRPCNCRGPKLKCKDFTTHSDAQYCFEFCKAKGFGDIFGLDKDGNGQVCSGLP